MVPEGMDSSRSSDYFTAMCYATRNEVFLTCIYWNTPSVDDESIATLHDKHVFVALMHMLCRRRVLGASPKRHLASIDPVEDITFDTGRRLIGAHDSVCRIFHEIGKRVHAKNANALVVIVDGINALIEVPT